MTHEFFHTVEAQFRDIYSGEEVFLDFSNLRKNIVLRYGDEEYTLDDWWQEFEELFLSNPQQEDVSQYCEAFHGGRLNRETKAQNI